ncbi:MAG: CsbD family protein [Methylobacter sp.]
MNKDQIKGRAEEATGKIKEITGKILDDDELEQKGNVQNNVGKVRAGIGDLKEDIKKSH